MSETKPAVFLSYASQDSEAARRIAAALRAFGVEVWLDQSELRGGDAWDQKIRHQIHECALFVPIISATTQERGEGYFRREWHLAIDRTLDLAEGVPFIVPVAIDDTSQATAAVPEAFLRVQWARLPHGVPTPQFVELVRTLLAAPRRPVAVGAATGSRGMGSETALVPPADSAGWRRQTFTVGALGLIALAVAASFYFGRRSTALPPLPREPAIAAVPKKSLAVLPFENLSTNEENRFLADGIHLELLGNLGNLRELHVASRPAVLEYRQTTKKPRQIGAELGVAYVLTGDVRRDGARVRVTVQLSDAYTDRLIWSSRPDTRELSDIFALQSEIAQAIAAELNVVISPEEKQRIERRPTDNLEAYKLYVQACQPKRWSQWGDDGWEKRREVSLQTAVELDPNFAVAWAALGAVMSVRMGDGSDVTTTYARAAEQAIEMAMRLAPDSPEVLRHRAEYLYRRWDYTGATELCDRLLRLRPDDHFVLWLLGIIQRRQGRWAEAHSLIQQALRLDPGNREYADNLVVNLLWGVRRFPEALGEQRKIVARFPESLDAAFQLARIAFWASGSTREMGEFFAKIPDDKATSAEVMRWRRDWARMSGDFAEAVRLDRLHAPLAEVAAMTLAATGAVDGMMVELGKALAECRTRLEAEPGNYILWARLAKIEGLRGNRPEALRCLARMKDSVPDARDLLFERLYRRTLAEIYAWTGEKERAVAEYARLLQAQWLLYVNVHELRHGPEGVPLRNYAPFQALLDDPKNNAPLN